MRLLVLSDLHLELGTSLTLPPELEYDVAILAGDIHAPGHKAVHWAQRDSTFGGRPVVLVPGNHEFYRCVLTTELQHMTSVAGGSDVQLLNRGAAVIDGVRFLGCTLWTDFQLPIHRGDVVDTDVAAALEEANRRLNDFELIDVAEPTLRGPRGGSPPRRRLRAEDTLAMHWVDRDWLRRQLAEPFDGQTVVVTHHAPAAGSVAPGYAGDALTPAFVSELPDELFKVPVLWVHGHTHTAADYRRGGCRVLSNPRGYRLKDGSFENGGFHPGLVVEVGPASTPYVPLETWEHDSNLARLAERGDMVGLAEAAKLAGVSEEQLRRWAALKHPRVIALDHPQLGLRLPRWQFDARVRPVAERLAKELGSGGVTALAWLETPLGALAGRAPRAALEQGELAERVLALAGSEGL